MKNNSINQNNLFRLAGLVMAVLLLFTFSGCNEDDPQKEDTPEMITKATLTFTPAIGAVVVATATDPDGEGVQDITVDNPINLEAGNTYTLVITLINELAQPSDPAYNISNEVEAEGGEHLFFFEWTNNVFSDPAGNGNFDNRNDKVNYEDQDANAMPIGLQTAWTAGAPGASGTFRVVLKHQPGLKSATSDSATGETDLDVRFGIHVQ